MLPVRRHFERDIMILGARVEELNERLKRDNSLIATVSWWQRNQFPRIIALIAR